MDSTAPEQAGPPPIEQRIESFWQEHGEALTTAGHPDSRIRNEQLTALYHEKTGEPLPEAQPEPSLADFVEKPAAAHEYDIGPQSRFGMNVGPYEEWSAETETQARDWMAAAGMSQSSAQIVASAYVEVQRDSYKADRAAVTSQAMIAKDYSGQTDIAIDAMRRVVLEAGGESLKSWLNETGLGNHPLVVREVLSLAERKGYIRKGA